MAIGAGGHCFGPPAQWRNCKKRARERGTNLALRGVYGVECAVRENGR